MIHQIVCCHGGSAHLRVQEIFYFLVGNVDSPIDHASLQFLQGQLTPHLFAGLSIDAFLLKGIDILIECHIALPRKVFQHAIKCVIVKTDTRALSQLQLNALDDQQVQNFLAHLFRRRQGPIVQLGVFAQFRDAGIQFALQNDVLVYNGYDLVQAYPLGLTGQ